MRDLGSIKLRARLTNLSNVLVGVKAANALSDYLIVNSVRDNKIATMKFEKGIRKSFEVKDNIDSLPRGTTIEFLPDKDIFKEEGIVIPKVLIEKQLKELSYLCSGLKIDFKYKKDKSIQYLSKDGLTDYIHELVPQKDMNTKVYKINISEDKYKADIVFTYSNKVAENIKLFTNNIPNTGGTHLTGFKSTLTRVLNDTARSMGLLKEKEENLSGDDLREGLNLIISLKMNDPVFNGQTKEILTSAEARTFIEQNISAPLKQIFLTNYEDIKTIIEKAKLSRKARLAAKAAREATKKKEKTVLKSSLQGKLADCLTKDSSKAELFLVEGERKNIAHLF